MKSTLLFTGMMMIVLPAFATDYYVNSRSGNDLNPGTSESMPWKSISVVNSKTFQPGDVVSFARGENWTGELEIASCGTKEKPLIFKSYGSGNKPVISNPEPAKFVVDITGSWIVLDGFLVKDSHDAAVHIAKGASHNVVRNCEMTNTGMGVGAYGKYNLFTLNYVHDLHIINNTPRDVNPDDDYGAVAFWMFAPCNEISYNKGINCIAPSYDYGHDGGFFEIYGNGDSTYVHHNWAENCCGFHESGAGPVRGVIIAYNVAIDNGGFICLHLGKGFHADVENMRIENNTIISKKGTTWNKLLDWAGGKPSPSIISVRNNIFVIGGEEKEKVCAEGNFIHTNNLYYLLDGASVGFDLSSGEMVADPLFINLDKDDYHPGKNSPAIDAGINLGYTSDFDGKPVPSGKRPDIGAFEY